MAHGSLEVTYTATDQDRIPDSLTEGTVLLMDLQQRGIVDTLGELVRIRRQGGDSGLDAWLFLPSLTVAAT